MPSHFYKYYFGRLNVISSYSDKKSFLIDLMRPGVFLENRGNRWTFTDIEEFKDNDETYIHGFLVKYIESCPEETIDLNQGKINQTHLSNKTKGKARFFIHVKSGIIAYHPFPNQISSDQFIIFFCKIFQLAQSLDEPNTEIKLIEESYEIIERINDFSSIHKISFKLHPSNPNSRPLWKDIDEDIQNMEATSYTEEYSVISSDRDGLNLERIKTDENLRAKFFMADDGYGEAKVSGKVNGQPKTFKTGDVPSTTRIYDFGSVSDVFSKLKPNFSKFFDKFKN
jgi:hypothetical protein